ncbi:hypothetical protein FDZ73_22415 [bacterium]|nr:MAG: hypothetical protein FDZ73_22415 [bacterium]
MILVSSHGEIMTQGREPLEIFWDAVLSRNPEQIRTACFGLDEKERMELIAHLQRMVNEEGWHPEQRKSAQTALDTVLGSKQS